MKRMMVLALAAMSVTALFADKVIMNSGTILTGTVNGIKDGVVKFKSDDFGDMDIDPGKVKFIQDQQLKPVQVSELKVIPKDPEVWHGSVNVSFLAARGNTYQNSWSVVANLNRRWEKDRLNADFGYYYGENGRSTEDPTRTTDRWEAELKHDHFWLEKVYSYEDVRYERDMMQELSGRYRLGLGLGYQWLENAELAGGKWNFNQEFGVNWIKEEFENNPDERADGFCALRYAHHLGWVPSWAKTVEVFHNFDYLPEVDDWDKFLIKADAGFTTKIIMNFDLLCKLEWDYNSMPAEEMKKSDLRYIVGLGYKW